MAGLNHTLVGSGRPRFVFLHGLFGRGRNWTQIAQGLAETSGASVLFDLPNHGASPWTDSISYPQMAEAAAAEIEQRLGSPSGVILVGHSMGGKVAMLTALTHPDLLSGLAVIDIAPTDSAQVSGFGTYIEAMQAVDLSAINSRADAEAAMAAAVPNPAVRQFLLTNLRERDGWHWQPNLPLLAASLPELASWPDTGSASFDGPVSWIVGERSPYYRRADHAVMQRYFPAVREVVIPDAAHWVHADNPRAVISALTALSSAAPS